MRWIRAVIHILLLGMLGWSVYVGYRYYVQRHPQDFPWTALDLAHPVGLFTGRKLAALTHDTPLCRALLDQEGVKWAAAPSVHDGQCGYADGVRLSGAGDAMPHWTPSTLAVSCPVAAALVIWHRDVVQPAARLHLGSVVKRINHLGAYSCRRLYGRETGAWSEHATADAIDIAGFELANGEQVRVKRDWAGAPNKQAFLRAVRDGACDVFSTVLSPDYNEAHADHLHLDQASRGEKGWRVCR